MQQEVQYLPHMVATISVSEDKRWTLEPVFIMAKDQEQAQALAKKSLEKHFKEKGIGIIEIKTPAREVSWEGLDEAYRLRPQPQMIITPSK